MKRLRVLLAAGCLIVGLAGTSQADTIWTLQNVHFTDQATATGSFTVNTALDTILDWDITVAGSVNPDANHVFKKGLPNEVAFSFNPADFAGFANFVLNPNRYLDLFWGTPLTNAGGVINLLVGDPSNPPFKATIDCPGCGVMNTQGQLVGSTVGGPIPEPAMFLLVGTGLAGLARRRRRQMIA